MDVISFTNTRQNLKRVMDKVVSDHAPVVVTRQKGEAVVMMSLADWNAMEETARLLGSPANAARLGDAIDQLDAGRGTERDLIEP
jgi:antitoxin YefM